MSTIRRLFFAFMPQSWRDSAEAESKLWMMRCPNCGYEISYWDSGGIRWKAAGNPKLYRKCPSCGKREWFTVYKRNAQ